MTTAEPTAPDQVGRTASPGGLQSAAIGRQSTRTNFYWTLAGNVIYAACQWATYSLIAKLGSPAMLGGYALALAITTPAVLLASGPKFIQITAHDTEFTFGDYMLSRLVILTGGTVVIGLIAFLSHYDAATMAVIGLVTAAKVFDSLSDGVYGLLQQREVMDRIAQSRILQGVLQVLGLAIMLVTTHSVVWGALSLAVMSAFVTMTFDARSAASVLAGTRASSAALRRTVHALANTWTAQSCWKLSILAAPASVVAGVMTINSSLLRYLVEKHLGAADLGIFAAMAYCGFAGMTVINAMGQAILPALARRMRTTGLTSFRALLTRLIVLAAILGAAFLLVALLWGRPLMTLLYTREYASNPRALALIALASAIAYVGSAFGYGLAAGRYLKTQIPINAAATVVTFFPGLYLMRSRGLEGVAITMILAALVQTAGNAFALVASAALSRPTGRRGAEGDAA
jgi:O-antigen/teichoic acid export membrane protein